VGFEGHSQRRTPRLAPAEDRCDVIDGDEPQVLRLGQRPAEHGEAHAGRHVQERLGRRGYGEAVVPHALDGPATMHNDFVQRSPLSRDRDV